MRPLNVVVVTIDTLRPDHLHCYGYQPIETPVLDGIAQSGVLFENAVTQTPLTLPSHASIFTGLYPTKHHVRNTGGFVLPSSSKTLATILQQQGWDTAAFVSSDVLKRLFGFNRGFAVYDDQMPRQGNQQNFLEDPERNAGETIDRALGWLNKQSGKPFFLWVHLYDPHMPYRPPLSFREKYKGRPYDREIAYVDHELGRLFDAVHRKSAQTLIGVLSDQGESLGEHGEYSHGIFLYDATMRIAFMVSGPGIPAGLRVRDQARTIDFLPTILELMGGKASAEVQGASLLPSLARKEVPTAISYGETLYPKINMGWAELRAIRTNRWKYIRAPKPELYDLAQDPAENHNVIQSHAVEAQKFEAQLQALSGPRGVEKVETTSVDLHTMDELKSLGYLSGMAQVFALTGQGADPKDRVGILKLQAVADDPDSQIPDARRIELLQQAITEDTTNPDLYFQLGARYEKASRHDEAIKLYYSALQKGVDNGRLHSRIADHLVRLGKIDEAIAEYERAARYSPDPESQMNLATAYLKKGRIADAERVFKWVVITDPSRAAAYNGLGLIAIRRQDSQTARGCFEKAAELDPNLMAAQLNLGLIYKMSGDRVHARRCFETFLAKASPAQYGAIIPKITDELASLR